MPRRNEKERKDYKPALENNLGERENTEKHHEERQTDKEKEGEDYKPALENTLGERENTEKHHEERQRLTRRRKGRITNLPLRTLWGKT